MVIAPHARFAARNARPLGHMIPAVRPVIHRVQEQPLMSCVAARGTARRSISVSSTCRPACSYRVPSPPRVDTILAKPQQPLCGDRRRRAVHRLVIVEGIRRPRAPVAKRRQPWRAGVPVRDSIRSGRVIDVKVARRARQPRYSGSAGLSLPVSSSDRSSRETPAARQTRASPRRGRASMSRTASSPAASSARDRCRWPR